jgi:hypothetical protein
VYGVWDGPAVSVDLVVPEKKEDDKDCPIKNLLSGSGDIGSVKVDDDEPDDDFPEITCFWRTTHELRQPCGDNELIDSWETIDRVKCPDDIADRTPTVNSPMSLGYIEEIDSRYYYEVGQRTIPEYLLTTDPRFAHECEACTEDGFRAACCRDRVDLGNILEPIPPCLEIKSTFYGGVEIEKGRQYWLDKYPGGVTFQPKLPAEGFCGTKTISFDYSDCQQCPVAYIKIVPNSNSSKDDIISVYNGEEKILELKYDNTDIPKSVYFDPSLDLTIEYYDDAPPGPGGYVEWYVYHNDRLAEFQPKYNFGGPGPTPAIYYKKIISPVC